MQSAELKKLFGRKVKKLLFLFILFGSVNHRITDQGTVSRSGYGSPIEFFTLNSSLVRQGTVPCLTRAELFTLNSKLITRGRRNAAPTGRRIFDVSGKDYIGQYIMTKAKRISQHF